MRVFGLNGPAQPSDGRRRRPATQRATFPREHLADVLERLSEISAACPTPHWGFNYDSDDHNLVFVVADDTIDLGGLLAALGLGLGLGDVAVVLRRGATP